MQDTENESFTSAFLALISMLALCATVYMLGDVIAFIVSK